MHQENRRPKSKMELTKSKRKYRRVLIGICIVSMIAISIGIWIYWQKNIPSRVRILVDHTETFDFGLPITADFEEENVGVLAVNNSNIPVGQLKIDLQKEFKLRAEETGSYALELKLFGIIPFKKVELDVLKSSEVIPCGYPIGILLDTKGVLVLGTGTVTTKEEGIIEPAAGILQTGDYIIAVDGKELDGKEKLAELVKNGSDNEMKLTVVRNGMNLEVRVRRVKATDGNYKIGVWVRDDTQGIGTLTYITTDGRFAALGHGISDVDTGVLMEAEHGEIYKAEIVGISKGRAGNPGELAGVIHRSDEYLLGEVARNSAKGVYGTIRKDSSIQQDLEKNSKLGTVELGMRNSVRKGKASILCQFEDKLDEYEIEIENVDYSNSKQSKGIVIHITDERLLEKTGGIVQGMSGSPIIQNGKLIGAVTHVFIKDPTRGYGTFIENMLPE